MDLKKKLTLLAALVCTSQAGYLGAGHSGDADSYSPGLGSYAAFGGHSSEASYPSGYVAAGGLNGSPNSLEAEIHFRRSSNGLSGIGLEGSAGFSEVSTLSRSTGDIGGFGETGINSLNVPSRTVYRDVPYTVVKDVAVPVLQPYPVHVPQPVAVPVDKLYPVHVPVYKHLLVPVIHHRIIKIDKPVPVPVEKIIHVPVERIVKIQVDNPVPVEKIVEVPVYKKVHVPVHVVKHVPVPTIIEEVSHNSDHNKGWW